MWCFVPESFATGLLTVVNTYVSQNVGAGREKHASRYVWAGMFLAACMAAAMAPLAAVARPAFALFQHAGRGGAVLDLEVMYFRYMILGAPLVLAARPIEQFFFGIHRSGIVLAASLVANVVNVAANYVLIFGKLGLPPLGLEGAAIGSLAAWTVQLALLLGVFLSRRCHRRYASRAVRRAGWRHVRALLRIGWPAGVQFSNDVLTWSVFIAVLVKRQFGEAHLAASVVAMRYMGLSFMPAIGIGIGTTALVGQHIGQGRRDLARRRVHTAVRLAVIYMGLCGLAFWVFRYPLVRFLVSEQFSAGATMSAEDVRQTISIAASVMLCAAVFQLFDALGIVYVGALRGAGDTRWPMLVTLGVSWGLTVGAGAAMVHLFGAALGSIAPWIAASAYVVVLGVLVAWRFESGPWERIDLLGRRAPTPAPVEPAPVPPSAAPAPGMGPVEAEENG